MDTANVHRHKRRRLTAPLTETEFDTDDEQSQIVQVSSAANASHVYSSPIHLDGNAQAVFGNVSNIGRHFHVASDEAYQRSFFNKVYFEGMDARRHQIVNPGDTVEWIWTTNIMAWLQSANPLFWIRGKPGTGKSVLTRYVSESFKTLVSLQVNGQKWITLNFFFAHRSNGTANTIHGMLRSLLYQLVRLLPEARQLVHSAYFVDNFCNDDLQDCMDALCDIMRCTSTRVCVFIDGLDEVEGSISDLLEVIQALQARTGIKVCVASRAENALERILSNFELLVVEDHNYPGIVAFLDKSIRTASLGDWLHMSRDLSDQLGEKSGGVFLWATLIFIELLHRWEVFGEHPSKQYPSMLRALEPL